MECYCTSKDLRISRLHYRGNIMNDSFCLIIKNIPKYNKNIKLPIDYHNQQKSLQFCLIEQNDRYIFVNSLSSTLFLISPCFIITFRIDADSVKCLFKCLP